MTSIGEVRQAISEANDRVEEMSSILADMEVKLGDEQGIYNVLLDGAESYERVMDMIVHSRDALDQARYGLHVVVNNARRYANSI